MQQILEQLDEQQRAAATALLGPVAIRAGAGSGKTRTITHRIAHGVASGVYNPDKVLALSYTRKAALELGERLAQLQVPGVTSRTFHSLALEQLHEFWPTVVGGERPTPLGSTAKLLLVQQAATEAALQVSDAVAREILAELEWRKVSALSYEGYLSAQRTGVVGVKPQQVVEVMRAYEELKISRRVIDFEDVIALTAGMLAAEDAIARKVQQRFRYFTVDEYQDISPLQYTLLHEWLGENNNNLCVVGDASQTIFSFAGANQNFLLRFAKEYPEATTITLHRNYRSTAGIVTAANNLMRQAPGAIELQAVAGGGSAPRAAWFRTGREELQAVTAAVKQQISAGTPESQIAVLARTNQQLAEISEVLRASGVKTQLPEDPWLFSFPVVKNAVIALKAAAAQADAQSPQQDAEHTVLDVLRAAGYSTKAAADPEREAQRRLLQRLLAVIDTHCAALPLPEIAKRLQEMMATHFVPQEAAVVLLPIHSAKGLEWHTVYIIGASEGKLPIQQTLDNAAAIAEEQRLAYVAFTRARELLRVSLSGSEQQGVAPSRFLQQAKIPVQRF
ncbi:ATP-dependent helicase [Leucobacter sp. OH2974_COT-288]|nr:ATP-dependent helicase [Leucobacter sp. OH2974_COT-288]